ncbi:T9SS type B sorting domain-containing protein [Brumimicrobium glaciale]|uniref:T9SS type B sorting domain-containing protein n=1 Tax=Brumimicrobium glaciale TaxID=200475 RepID=A0A4Q4KTH5_9FLAO|nr:choice-of-anchor L domain-containing protein [Brumimicrobium glaciale]RYM36049.1 T9SS type B sorting domain-containing protein [Brumimicrobium glaciale]
MKNWILLLLSAFAFSSAGTFAQQLNLVQPTMTPLQAVENVLLGAGINAFNITYNGSAALANQVQQGVKRFKNTDPNFPISGGVLMHTSGAPNISDPDLAMITPNPITNGSIIEFDFVPSGDTLSFNYIFSSTEYSGFTCSNYNDVFGFFISGPGINGPFSNNGINIATVPGSNNIPVGINSVNSGSPTGGGSASNCAAIDPNWQANSVFFTLTHNTIYTAAGQPMSSYNGSTVLLPANSNLSCSDTFHIKLAISNCFDTGLDSGVFLEANSFSSNLIDISIQTSADYSDTLLIEGCMEATVAFTRPSTNLNDTLVIDIQVGGTADTLTDYPVFAPGDSLIFLPGVDTIFVTISPIDDGVAEGPESIIISAYSITVCGDTVYSYGTIWIDDKPNTTTIASDTTILCANDSVPVWATTENGFPPYTYNWSNGTTGANSFAAATSNGPTTYIVTATDDCGFESSDTTTIILNQTLKIDSLIQNPADCGVDNGYVVGFGHVPGYTGTPKFKWTGPGTGGTAFTNASVWSDKPTGWYYFSITDDVCSVLDSIFLEQDPPPTADFDADPAFGFAPLDVTFTNNSDPATTYYWDFGNGETATVGSLNDQNTTYFEEGVYTVTLVTEKGECTDETARKIIVTLPLGYEMPNVFTPNGDGQNDFFTLNAENAQSLEIVILNRWGNKVFESTDVNFMWNGKVNNSGAECSDGTYFYKFEIVDLSGVKKEEHGFVQLVND